MVLEALCSRIRTDHLPRIQVRFDILLRIPGLRVAA